MKRKVLGLEIESSEGDSDILSITYEFDNTDDAIVIEARKIIENSPFIIEKIYLPFRNSSIEIVKLNDEIDDDEIGMSNIIMNSTTNEIMFHVVVYKDYAEIEISVMHETAPEIYHEEVLTFDYEYH